MDERILPASVDDETVGRIVAVLRAGRIVALPTDTLPGLSVIASDSDAVARVAALKGYATPRPFVLLFDGSSRWRCAWTRPLPVRVAEWADRHWPGPVTIVCAASASAPPHLVSEDGGLALRWADHPLCQRVLAALGEPIISTSVNAKDEAPRTTAAAIAAFPGDVALVVDAPVGVARASALVDGRTEPPRVLRAGAVRVEWDEPKPS